MCLMCVCVFRYTYTHIYVHIYILVCIYIILYLCDLCVHVMDIYIILYYIYRDRDVMCCICQPCREHLGPQPSAGWAISPTVHGTDSIWNANCCVTSATSMALSVFLWGFVGKLFTAMLHCYPRSAMGGHFGYRWIIWVHLGPLFLWLVACFNGANAVLKFGAFWNTCSTNLISVHPIWRHTKSILHMKRTGPCLCSGPASNVAVSDGSLRLTAHLLSMMRSWLELQTPLQLLLRHQRSSPRTAQLVMDGFFLLAPGALTFISVAVDITTWHIVTSPASDFLNGAFTASSWANAAMTSS